LDWRTGEQGSSDEKEARVKVTTVGSHGRERSMDRRNCGEPSCMGDNFPRQSHNTNHGFSKGLYVSIKIIVGRKEGYSKPSMCAPRN
jgi:hypothetical protein